MLQMAEMDKRIFYLPADMSFSKLRAVRRGSAYRQLLKRIGLLSCGIVFLTGLQLLQPPAVETAHTQLHSSDTLHLSVLTDALLEEAREGEYRLVLGLVASAAFMGILLLVTSSLFLRQLPSKPAIVHALHSSRAPPVV